MPALKYWDTATSAWKTGAIGLPSGQVWQQIIGDGVNTNFVVTHGFGTRAVYVSVYRNSPPYDEVEVDVERTDTSSVTIRTSPTIPAVSEYIVAVAAAGTQATLNVTMDTWHYVGQSGEPAFGAGWANRAGLSEPVGFRKFPDGKVRLKGLATATSGGTIFTLPVGYRPVANKRYAVEGETTTFIAGGGRVIIYADGTVAGDTVSGITTWCLDVVEFDTESVLQTASVAAQPLDTIHYVGAPGEPTFTNSWVNYDNSAASPGTATQRSLRFRKFPDGRVRVSGVIKNGVAAAIFTLPAGYRPASVADVDLPIACAGGMAYVSIQSGGVVAVSGNTAGAAAATYTYMEFEFDSETVNAYATGTLGPPKVTTLPTNPIDGQECYYVADATNGVLWHLRYNAASASTYKWEFVGGSPIWSVLDVTENVVGDGAWHEPASNPGPQIAAPLAGDYEVGASANMYCGSAASIAIGVTVGATTPGGRDQSMFYEANAGQVVTPVVQTRLTAVTVGGLMRIRYLASAGTAVTRLRQIRATPVRVG